VSSRTARVIQRNPVSKNNKQKQKNKTKKKERKRKKEKRRRGWKDGSVVKSANCSSEGPEFKSQQPHGGSQPSIMRSDPHFWCI
jgi:ribosome assembly protein YihI (activator of Der GTPase)